MVFQMVPHIHMPFLVELEHRTGRRIIPSMTTNQFGGFQIIPI